MSRSREARKIRRWDAETFTMSTENLNNLNRILPCHYETKRPYLAKPITFSKHATRHQKRNSMLQTESKEVFKQPQPKGIVFVWPRRKSFNYEREYSISLRILAQVLYWLHEAGIFPSGAGVPLKRPPWKILRPLPKPENRDYIIEPDWNSVYLEG